MGILRLYTPRKTMYNVDKRGDVMQSVIFNPVEEFKSKYKDLHAQNTRAFFERLVQQSGVDVEQNRQTVRLYNEYKENLSQLRKKLNWRRFWRVLMCLTLVLIPVVILKVTPKIRELKAAVEEADKKAEELLAQAHRQMEPLNRLFGDRDSLQLIQQTIPLLSFDTCFSAKQEEDMRVNYDFAEYNDEEQSTIDVLAGRYNENPFLFENKKIHTMGTETYHGYKTIHWTETYTDSDGKLRTRHRSQTLHATVEKPKPFFTTQAVLNYCTQGGPNLCFTRDAGHLEQKSDREIERMVKRGERKLKRKSDRALQEDSHFTSLSNTEFEVMFDALDRTDEVQFRTLFTPLAQTNLVELLRSDVGYGDDFSFIKNRRTNRILSQHSQGRPLYLSAHRYPSYCFDTVRDNFLGQNADFFKAVYFDFAPLWSIPLYQERPVHSLKPLPEYARLYSLKECEVLANAVEDAYVVHPDTKTQAILKSTYVGSCNNVDETRITAYSYDIEQRVDMVSVYGEDGHYHQVPVEWDEYLPLEASRHFYVTANENEAGQSVIARRNGLCIYPVE